jgi:hypothetical protein
MVTESNVVFINLLGAKRVSIGCCMEMAWAHMLGKHTVLVMEEGNIHHHAFVLECADIVLPDYEEAIDYLIGLAEK